MLVSLVKEKAASEASCYWKEVTHTSDSPRSPQKAVTTEQVQRGIALLKRSIPRDYKCACDEQALRKY